MYKTRIISFEELTEKDGRIYTVYNIHVEDINNNKSWYLGKRYKHFGHLYRALKERYPQIAQYKFPNKSVFNTFSQFTKERRRSGFEEFLNLVTALRPIPPEMEDFLEVDDHTSSEIKEQIIPQTRRKNSQEKFLLKENLQKSNSNNNLNNSNNNNNNTNNNNNQITSTTSSSISSNHHSENNLSTDSSQQLVETKRIRDNIIKKMFLVITSSYISTTLFYAFLIYTSFVDVTSASTDRIILTMLSLGASVSLLRLSKMKRDFKQKEKIN